MSWNDLHFGTISKPEIEHAILNPKWQECRLRMKGVSTSEKLRMLSNYYEMSSKSRNAKVVVTNYINALLRGGQLIRRNNQIEEQR